jgi:hypothetical protein
MMPTTPEGMFNSADLRLVNPKPLMIVVEYVPVNPWDIAA